MKNIRSILTVLHVIMMILGVINLHIHLSLFSYILDHREHISAIIDYIIDLICIQMYHGASLVVLWSSRNNVGLVRASGISLISELLQILASIIRYSLSTTRIGAGELFLIITYGFLLLITIFITFQLARHVSKNGANSMHLNLLVDNMDNSSMNKDNKSICV